MDDRIKSGHDKRSGGGDAFERSWKVKGGRQPRKTEPRNLKPPVFQPAQQE